MEKSPSTCISMGEKDSLPRLVGANVPIGQERVGEGLSEGLIPSGMLVFPCGKSRVQIPGVNTCNCITSLLSGEDLKPIGCRFKSTPISNCG